MPKRIPTIDLIEDIKRVARELGHHPTVTEYCSLGTYSLEACRRRFGSWKTVIEKCGLRFGRHGKRARKYAEVELKTALDKVARTVGHPPSRTQYAQLGTICNETFYNHLKCRRWVAVLMHYYGLTEDQAKTYASNGRTRNSYRSNEDRLQCVRQLAEQLGHAPNISEAERGGINNTCRLKKRLGTSWDGVLVAAGLNPLDMTGKARARRMSNEEIFQDVLSVARSLRRFPTRVEYDKLGCVTTITVENRLGKLEAVRVVVAEKLNPVLRSGTLEEVHDPVRDKLKAESIDSIKEYFRNKQTDEQQNAA